MAAKIKKFLPYDKRIRIDEVTSKNIRDIMKFTGAKSEGEAVRNAVRANWQHLREEQDSIEEEAKKIYYNPHKNVRKQ